MSPESMFEAMTVDNDEVDHVFVLIQKHRRTILRQNLQQRYKKPIAIMPYIAAVWQSVYRR